MIPALYTHLVAAMVAAAAAWAFQGAHYMRQHKPMFIVGWADARLGNVPLARCAESVTKGSNP